MKKRILHYIPGFNIGGIESLFLDLVRNIDTDKYEIHLLTERKVAEDVLEYLKKNNVMVHENIYSIKKSIIKYYTFILRLLKKEKFNILHIHGFFTRPLILVASKYVRTEKIILHAHSTKLEKIELIGKNISKILLNSDMKYIACSKEAGECYFGKDRNIEVITNGIDFNKFRYNLNDKKEYTKNMKLENKKIIGMIGRISYPKNHKFAIEIFEKLNKIDKSYVLFLIGSEADEKEIPQLVKEKGLEDKIIFLGARNDIKELLSLIDVYLMPSIYEGLSVGLLEAQASGVQCLISDAITPKNIVTNNVKVLSLNDSPDIWAKAVIELYNKGREKIDYDSLDKSEYSIKTFVKKIEKIYD